MKIISLNYYPNDDWDGGVKHIEVNPQHIISMQFTNHSFERDKPPFGSYTIKLSDGTMIERVVQWRETESEDFDHR